MYPLYLNHIQDLFTMLGWELPNLFYMLSDIWVITRFSIKPDIRWIPNLNHIKDLFTMLGWEQLDLFYLLPYIRPDTSFSIKPDIRSNSNLNHI